MSGSNPNWQLLPHDPLSFFQLAPGFDRKALKRAYGNMIRLHKPETHPAEFQRIREAYEQLDSQNRYGVQQAILAQRSSAWEQSFDPMGASPTTGRRPEFVMDSQRRIEAIINDPVVSYQQLSEKDSRSPQEYFLLATLADLVDRKQANMYLKWLMAGIREHSDDPGLLRLLTEYLSAFGDAKLASSVMLSISKLVRADDFFRITERMWSRLLDDTPFESFAGTLAACEKNLHFTNLRPRLAFYARLLRKAAWKAPAQWTGERLRYLEKHGSELDNGLDEEVEFVSLLCQYREHDREALLQKPAGPAMDQLIQQYCLDASLTGMAKVALLCDQLARNGNDVCDTFPWAPSESSGRALLLCGMISNEVANEMGLDFEKPNPQRIAQQADATVADLRKTIDSISTRITWMRYRHYGLPFLSLLFGPLILVFGLSYWPLIAIVWGLIASMGFLAIIRPLWLDKIAGRKCQDVMVQEYEAQWRPRLVRYVQACHAPTHISIEQLLTSARDLGQSQIIEAILSYAESDRGLHLLSRLQLFVH